MPSLDEVLTRSAEGHGFIVVLLVGFLLGLRHATDPDHLVAVSTLIASVDDRRSKIAARLGAAWGTGHALTLLAFGLPVVLVHGHIPDAVQRVAEMLIGLVIVALALRLLMTWRRGDLHLHMHEHDGEAHSHLHSHSAAGTHVHRHPVRTTRQAFAIGAVHGLAGSAAVTVLLLAAVSERLLAALALGVLAVGTAISMTVLSSGLGLVLSTQRARRSLAEAAPAFALLAAGFGGWYALQALLAP